MKIYSYNFRVRYSTTYKNGYHTAKTIADSRLEAVEKAQKYMSELSAENDGVFSVCYPTISVKMNLDIKKYKFRFKKWYYIRRHFPEIGIVYGISKDDAISNLINLYGKHNVSISTIVEIGKETTSDLVTPIHEQVEALNSLLK